MKPQIAVTFDLSFRYPDEGVCECEIGLDNPVGGRLPLVGSSYCHPNDNFVKETGRLVALRKAVKHLDQFDKCEARADMKRILFEMYFDREFERTVVYTYDQFYPLITSHE